MNVKVKLQFMIKYIYLNLSEPIAIDNKYLYKIGARATLEFRQDKMALSELIIRQFEILKTDDLTYTC